MIESAQISPMLKHALQAQRHSYSPFSRFQVGACLRGANGKLYAGCNVENSSYGLTFCAEANAIGHLIADGETVIEEILVVGPHEEVCTPCGSCRQQLNEFAKPETPVHLCTPTGWRKTITLGELLPLSFRL